LYNRVPLEPPAQLPERNERVPSTVGTKILPEKVVRASLKNVWNLFPEKSLLKIVHAFITEPQKFDLFACKLAVI
jgi:hypothetical protein